MVDLARETDREAIRQLFSQFCELTDCMICSLADDRFESFLAQIEERNAVEQALWERAGARWLDSLPSLRPAVERALQQNENMMKLLEGRKVQIQGMQNALHREQRLKNLYRS